MKKNHMFVDSKFAKTYHKDFIYSHLFLYKNCTKFLLLLPRLSPYNHHPFEKSIPVRVK